MLQLTVVTPTGKVPGLETTTPLVRQTTLGKTQPSAAGRLQETLALLHWPASALAEMLPGQVISWQIVSTTTWSMRALVLGAVSVMVSEFGQGAMRQMDSSTTQAPVTVASSMVWWRL